METIQDYRKILSKRLFKEIPELSGVFLEALSSEKLLVTKGDLKTEKHLYIEKNLIQVQEFSHLVYEASASEKKLLEGEMAEKQMIERVFEGFETKIVKMIRKCKEEIINARFSLISQPFGCFSESFLDGLLNEKAAFLNKIEEIGRILPFFIQKREFHSKNLLKAVENEINQKFKDTYGFFREELGEIRKEIVGEMPSKVTIQKILKNELSNRVTIAGRGFSQHPNYPIYSVLCFNGDIEVRSEVNDTLLSKASLNLSEGNNAYSSIAWSPNGQLQAVASSCRRIIYFFDIECNRVSFVDLSSEIKSDIWRLLWVDQSNLLLGSASGSISLMHSSRNNSSASFSSSSWLKPEIFTDFNSTRMSSGIESLCLISEDEMIFAYGDTSGFIYFRQIDQTGINRFKTTEINDEKLHRERVRSLETNKEKTKMLSCGYDRVVKVYNLLKRKVDFEIAVFDDMVNNGIWAGKEEQFIVCYQLNPSRVVVARSDNGTVLFDFLDSEGFHKSYILNRRNRNEIISSRNKDGCFSSDLIRIKIA